MSRCPEDILARRWDVKSAELRGWGQSFGAQLILLIEGVGRAKADGKPARSLKNAARTQVMPTQAHEIQIERTSGVLRQ